MPGIAISGLASGLDVESLISSLMRVESAPRARLELRQGQQKAREEALREINSKLRTVSDAAAALRSTSLWADVQTVQSSAPESVSARWLSGTGPGGYQVEVSQLARAERRTYDFTVSGSAEQLLVNGATIDLAAGASLDDAVAAINSEPESGVYAVAVGGRLVLSSRETGAASTIAASGATIAEDPGELRAGLDAEYSVDGVAAGSASNVVADAIPGLELTLTALTTGAATLTVGNPGPDTGAIEEKVRSFVGAYNAAVDSIRARLGEERLPGAQTQAEANKGVLFGDSQLSGLLSRMRRLVDDVGLGAIGVGTGDPGAAVTASSGSVLGRLVIDEAELTGALETEPAAVRELLAGPSGLSDSLDELLDPTIGSGGAISARLDSIAAESRRLGDSMTRLDSRLEAREEALRSQFAALETLLLRSQSESEWLNGQLAALSAPRR
jgi:flagellar hook-associated protein 2